MRMCMNIWCSYLADLTQQVPAMAATSSFTALLILFQLFLALGLSLQKSLLTLSDLTSVAPSFTAHEPKDFIKVYPSWIVQEVPVSFLEDTMSEAYDISKPSSSGDIYDQVNSGETARDVPITVKDSSTEKDDELASTWSPTATSVATTTTVTSTSSKVTTEAPRMTTTTTTKLSTKTTIKIEEWATLASSTNEPTANNKPLVASHPIIELSIDEGSSFINEADTRIIDGQAFHLGHFDKDSKKPSWTPSRQEILEHFRRAKRILVH